MCYSGPMVYANVPKLVSIGLFCRPLAAKNPNFAVFGLQHLVVSPVGSSLRKLNTGAQLQTFPYPTVSQSFLYSNAFMAKSGAQTLTFKSVTDRQTNKRTSRQTKKLKVFGRPVAGEIRAPRNLAGDTGPRARSCASETFGV